MYVLFLCFIKYDCLLYTRHNFTLPTQQCLQAALIPKSPAGCKAIALWPGMISCNHILHVWIPLFSSSSQQCWARDQTQILPQSQYPGYAPDLPIHFCRKCSCCKGRKNECNQRIYKKSKWDKKSLLILAFTFTKSKMYNSTLIYIFACI